MEKHRFSSLGAQRESVLRLVKFIILRSEHEISCDEKIFGEVNMRSDYEISCHEKIFGEVNMRSEYRAKREKYFAEVNMKRSEYGLKNKIIE